MWSAFFVGVVDGVTIRGVFTKLVISDICILFDFRFDCVTLFSFKFTHFHRFSFEIMSSKLELLCYSFSLWLSLFGENLMIALISIHRCSTYWMLSSNKHSKNSMMIWCFSLNLHCDSMLISSFLVFFK